MENVTKCKNFLSTLIKLASSGKQSTETAANVKELVQSLLVRGLLMLALHPEALVLDPWRRRLALSRGGSVCRQQGSAGLFLESPFPD